MLGCIAAVSATESPSQLKARVDPKNMNDCFFIRHDISRYGEGKFTGLFEVCKGNAITEHA